MRYSDHGDHTSNTTHKVASTKGNVLKKMTLNADELFRLWKTDTTSVAAKGRRKRLSPTNDTVSTAASTGTGTSDLSPHHFAFSQMALEQEQQLLGKAGVSGTGSFSHENHHHHHHHTSKMPGPGLLSAVLESTSSQTDSNSLQARTEELKTQDGDSRGSSLETRSSLASTSVPSIRSLPQGKCLTSPDQPVSNDSNDNVDGNLIAFENDVLHVAKRDIHVISKDRMKRTSRADYRIQGLLGQGTFAQVFECVHLQTGRSVAIKVVKNKPAYTRQAAVEIDVFRALSEANHEETGKQNDTVSLGGTSAASQNTDSTRWDYMVGLDCYFMHKSHLCLVFEMLGLNLYEVLKKRQFRGLPLAVVRTLVKQAVFGIKELSKKNIVHCDLKPENILLMTEDDVESIVSAGDRPTSWEKRSNLSASLERRSKPNSKDPSPAKSSLDNYNCSGSAETAQLRRIKLIDFGSACFEGQSTHTYIQSRFYRSPEVLIGLPYDSAIDMWSLGCVAAELFLGLPILPGAHEHDQLGRISEMISKLPDWMLDQGSKANKFFVKYVPGAATPTPPPAHPSGEVHEKPTSPRPLPQWRIRTQQEYIDSLSQSEIRKKGGLAKLEKQSTNRYFKRKELSGIIRHKAQTGKTEDEESLDLFIHFLYGILDPDPWKRLTAHQAARHPFISGSTSYQPRKALSLKELKEATQANIQTNIYWEAPSDPAIYRRKLLHAQKMRKKQQDSRHRYSGRTNSRSPGAAVDEVSVRGRGSHSHEDSLTKQQQQTNFPTPQSHRPQGVSKSLHTLSSSLADLAQQPGRGTFVSDSTSISGSMASAPHQLLGQPQMVGSYAHLGTPLINDPDFAHALIRPGNIPGGGSVASSVDINSVQSQLFRLQGAMGSSYDSRQQSYSSQQMEQSSVSGRPLHVNLSNDQRPSLDFNLSHGTGGISHGTNDMQGQPFQVDNQLDAPIHANGSQFGIAGQDQASQFQQQLYFQQQHAALQQQQALLRQQQHALSLQQQQLQAYAMNPNVMQQQIIQQPHQLQNPEQFNGQNGAGGYYYVTAADGTPVLVQKASEGGGVPPATTSMQSYFPGNGNGSNNFPG